MSSVISEELAEFLRGGLAVVVATRDQNLRPEIERGWGIQLGEGPSTVTVCVCVPPGSHAQANLAANGAIAMTCSLPSTYRTVQLKGTAVALGAPTEEQLAAVRRHVDLFVEEVAELGVRPEGARSFAAGELISVTVAVRELYDQTPGAGAGAPL